MRLERCFPGIVRETDDRGHQELPRNWTAELTLPMHSLHLRTWLFLGAHARFLLAVLLLAAKFQEGNKVHRRQTSSGAQDLDGFSVKAGLLVATVYGHRAL
jgi:hypothetical protein